VRYLVYGVGAVGGVITGHLHRSGHDVTLVARGAHLAAIRQRGLTLDTHEATYVVDAPATDTAGAVRWTDDTVVLLTVKSHQTEAALADLSAHAPAGTAVVCVQNGVANEPTTLRRFARTYGITVMLPSEHLEPGVVVQKCHPVPGILDIGRFPGGTDDTTDQVAADLRSAGFVSEARADIMAWKYRKLVTNAVGDVGAVLPDEAETLKPLVRAECEAVLAASGIPAVSQEADDHRRGDVLVIRPGATGPNSLGQSLARGTSGLEVDFRAGEIVLLGRLHGVPTPANERVQRAAHELLHK
jgi:2-dehydropantoate 2-reductase